MTIELERCFEKRLRDRGLRVTASRREILDHAFRHFGHFSADELHESLRRHGSRSSRATVYRTLGHLVGAGLLRRYDLPERSALYEPVFGRTHHEHLVCDACGAILEFVQEDIERLQDEICRQHRFRPLRHSLQIHGICDSCQRRGAEPPDRVAGAAESPRASAVDR